MSYQAVVHWGDQIEAMTFPVLPMRGLHLLIDSESYRVTRVEYEIEDSRVRVIAIYTRGPVKP